MNNEKILISFPDGSQKFFPKESTLEDMAQFISPSLKKKSVVGKVNGKVFDMKRPIDSDCEIELLPLNSPEGIEVMRHTATHILAQAVKRLFGKVNLGIGPIIESGFYYDVDTDQNITKGDLVTIEKEMNRIVAENLPIQREVVSQDEAEKIFSKDPLKLELLRKIPAEEEVTIYKQGEFIDLCRGPHLPSTHLVKAFALTNVSGAYWQGNSDNKMLQRIYGVAFSSKKELDQYFYLLEEAKKRDHRRLGKQLDLFMFSDEAPGMPFYLANGQIIRNELETFLRNLQDSFNYREVKTPLMMNQRLWEKSGHWNHYKDNMYFSEVDHQHFALKPMNCPGHMLIFKDKLRSYRDLPIRMAEFGQVHRHEFSGSLNGLLRVRSFCQDDAHIFVAPTQIEEEITSVLRLIDDVYRTFGFHYEVELSTRPEKSMGAISLWNQAEGALKEVLKKLGYDFRINEGDGAFYGPKIDIHIKDALNRSHQCATVQLDFQMPEKFDLEYINEQNEKVRPVVIHRAVFGSIDRFLGILIEHFGGAFPTWLAPVQVKVLPVSNDAHKGYTEEVTNRLKQEGIRVEHDDREEKLGYKIREAQMNKIPFILVLGDKEVREGNVNVRSYGEKKTREMTLEAFILSIKHSIENKEIRDTEYS
ncbi:threonyl-tRNA synthetase [Halobacillus karajensis]|uniref:threonine--tRNA ligase n=1 Tax=Halobacillus karajensis TaxID=195088 RepID=UPI0008A7D6D2|nr:threonine--tRNA ligase [Halobacillus karajensis]SEI00830.1 threonyl-tRNA synthetase [Halobacillus karajensis]